MIYAVLVLNEAGVLRFHQLYHETLSKPLFNAISSALVQKATAKGTTSNLLLLSELITPDLESPYPTSCYLAFRKYGSLIVAFLADEAES